MIKKFVVLSILAIAATSFAQETVTLKEGVAIKTFNFFARNMFLPDPIEAKIVLGDWKTPKENDELIVGDKKAVWTKITANENGWFENENLSGGYLCINYDSPKEEIVLLAGFGYNLVYANGDLHVGNRYGTKDKYEPWEPRFDYSKIPINLKKGKNEFLFQVSTGKLKVNLIKTGSGIFFNTNDTTLPDLIVGEKPTYMGAVVVINATDKLLNYAELNVTGEFGIKHSVDDSFLYIQPMSVRKIPFNISGETAAEKIGNTDLDLTISEKSTKKILAQTKVNLRIVKPSDNHKVTFLSGIDHSVQYYSINPASVNDGKPKALFLSVHGAAVEALNQSSSYFPKTWGHIVSPTNRRPFGFNWEDWGRTDALEVLNHAKHKLDIDPNRVYLTGHSMGGHGTWHLGATFPDKFAALGPSAGWISFWSYRVRERNENAGEMEKMIMRATNPSDTYGLAENYKQQGVYVIHGKDDDNVPATESRNMVAHLKKFHNDFYYHEEPDANHWWDKSDEEGADCVDWAPLFDFFSRHSLPQTNMVREIDFITANPGISSTNHWVGIYNQIEQMKMSRVKVHVDPGKNRFVGTTENISKMFFLTSIIDKTKPVEIDLDGQKLSKNVSKDTVSALSKIIFLEKENNTWRVVNIMPNTSLKNPKRNGGLKSAINHNVIFIYGTSGNKEENNWSFQKARFDAEQFWYQGNGSIKILSDKEFLKIKIEGANFIIYGNSETNLAWKKLLNECPVQISNGKMKVGTKEFKGDDLAALFVYPQKENTNGSIGVISGTGITGMKLTDRRLYLQPGYPFPDLMIFNKDFVTKGIDGVLSAGYFGIDWTIEKGEFIWK